MNLSKHIKSDKFKWIITFVSIILLISIVIALGVNIGRMQTTTTMPNSDYHIGSIDSTTGNVIDSKKNIYSDMNTIEDLDIDLEDGAVITYKVAFYGEDKEFVSITESQSADFDNINIPESAEYFRVLITPLQVDGEDVTISILNMNRYVNMLDVVFAK